MAESNSTCTTIKQVNEELYDELMGIDASLHAVEALLESTEWESNPALVSALRSLGGIRERVMTTAQLVPA
jgi:hypothetical protein